MKKMFLSLVAAIVAATTVYGQSQVATLTHDGVITTFYGYNGLQSAHDAAVSGDIITLSSGNFQGITITKAINLRGAGMQTDTENNILPSYVVGNVTINIPEEETRALTVEGVQFKNEVVGGVATNYSFLKNATFTKCLIRSFYNLKLQDVQFIQCKIRELRPNGSALSFSAINCFIRRYVSWANGIFRNCIVGGAGANENASFYNCILWGGYLLASCTAENCVGSTTFSSTTNSYGYSASYFKDVAQTNNTNTAVSSLFKTYRYKDSGSEEDWENETFELTDEAKAAYLGDDGKEVGIYGGLMPFDPTPSYPRITKCDVAPKSTVDGKLSVDIEVTTVE